MLSGRLATDTRSDDSPKPRRSEARPDSGTGRLAAALVALYLLPWIEACDAGFIVVELVGQPLSSLMRQGFHVRPVSGVHEVIPVSPSGALGTAVAACASTDDSCPELGPR